MNAYLKEIADLCGIKKNLSTHVARHSFACIAPANKVSMESIAKMLGHSDIKTTKIYAKVLDRTISEEMQTLREKYVSQKVKEFRLAKKMEFAISWRLFKCFSHVHKRYREYK